MKLLLLLSGVNPSLFAPMPAHALPEVVARDCDSLHGAAAISAEIGATLSEGRMQFAPPCQPMPIEPHPVGMQPPPIAPLSNRSNPVDGQPVFVPPKDGKSKFAADPCDVRNGARRKQRCRSRPAAGTIDTLVRVQTASELKATALRDESASDRRVSAALNLLARPAGGVATSVRLGCDTFSGSLGQSLIARSAQSVCMPARNATDFRDFSQMPSFRGLVSQLRSRSNQLFNLFEHSAFAYANDADTQAGAPPPGSATRLNPKAKPAEVPPSDLDQSSAEEPEERVATLSLPVTVNGRPFVPITASITTERVVAVPATDVVRTLAEVVDDATLDSIVALGERSVDVAELAQLGVLVTLNTGTLSIEIIVSPGILRRATIQASQELTFSGVERIQPSNFSFGVTGGLIASSPLDESFDPRAVLGIAGFLNIGGIEGLNVDYGGDIALNNAGERALFQRDRITAFKDWPDQALRISAGDLLPNQARLAGNFDIAGLSLERNYEALQPIRNIRPTASRSLQLDRRSIVEVYVNEVLVERFFAEPGPLDITQIPLASFSNNVKIVVEDSLGRREVDSFVFGSDITLLGQGIDQFDFAVGFLRNAGANGFSYSNNLVASAFYERGLTTNLTVAGHALISGDRQNVGGAAALGVAVGTLTADFAFSRDDVRGNGFAAGMTFRGSPFFGPDQGEFATLTVDYRSAQFTTIGEVALINNIKFDLRAEYQINVSEKTAVFASANYAQPHGDQGSDGFYSAGVRHNFSSLFVTLAGRYADRAATGGELGVLLTVTVPLGRRDTITATYDTASSRGRAEFRRQRGLTLPEVDYRIGVSTDPGGESLFGSFGYANSRFDADADVATQFGSGLTPNQTVASVRLQSGFGFADGKLAFGRDPARGFAILSRHPSIKDSTLTARTSAAGRELGIANDFGPGLFAVNAPFRPQQIAVDARDIPIGYNIGAGRYLLESGARSGLVIEVGSENYRTVVTTLTFDGQPVSLEYGRFRRLGDEAGMSATFFTNRGGRAAFSDLGPGEYLVEFPELGIEGRFTVEKDADALIRIDRLEMKRP